MRRLSSASIIGFLVAAMLIAFAPAANAGWSQIRIRPAVVACYTQIDSPYGTLRRVRTAMVNDTSSNYVHWISTRRRQDPLSIVINSDSTAVNAGVWGRHMYAHASPFHQDTVRISMSNSSGQFVWARNYSYSGIGNLARC